MIMMMTTMSQSTLPKTNGAAVGVGVSVGVGVGVAVGTGVGATVGVGVGVAVGTGVGEAVGAPFTVTETAVDVTTTGILALSVT